MLWIGVVQSQRRVPVLSPVPYGTLNISKTTLKCWGQNKSKSLLMRTCQAFSRGKVSQSQWCCARFQTWTCSVMKPLSTSGDRRGTCHDIPRVAWKFMNTIRSLKHDTHKNGNLESSNCFSLSSRSFPIAPNKKKREAGKHTMALRFLPCCSIDPVLAGSHPSQSLLMTVQHDEALRSNIHEAYWDQREPLPTQEPTRNHPLPLSSWSRMIIS